MAQIHDQRIPVGEAIFMSIYRLCYIVYISFQTPWTGGACLILLVLIVVSTCTCQFAAPRNRL